MNKKLYSIIIFTYFAIGIVLFFYFLISGWDYYDLPIEQRVFHPKHSTLKPSGLVGHGLGIIGSLMMIVGVSSYMIRKRWRRLHRLGYLKHWLEFHIFLCSVGPMLILFHSAFKFGGIISIGFWSMVVVVLSGVIGRVIYIQLPKTLQGENLSKHEIEQIISELLLKLDPLYQKELLDILDLNLSGDSPDMNNQNLKKEFSFIYSLKTIFKEYSRRRIKLNLLKKLINSKLKISIETKKNILKSLKR